MKNRTSISISLIALLLAMGTYTTHAQSTAPSADIPRTISYQGRLSNPDRSPVLDGTYPITVSLCANPDGTGKVWQETYSTSVTGGVFNLYLGSGKTPLPDPAIMNAPLWIATQIGDNPLMSPLSPLSASPYALNVSNGAITTGKLADGAVTAEKVNMPYISGIAINGQPITAKGTVLNIEGSDDITLDFNDATNTLRLSKPAPALREDNEKGASVLGTTSDFWTMRGDGRTDNGGVVTPTSGDWIGTSNSVTFETRVNGQTAMRYQPSGTNTPNVVGGYSGNSVTSASIGSVIAGGGANTLVNQIDNDADFAVISGGKSNTASSDYSSIGGGIGNNAAGYGGTIAGGMLNSITGGYQAIGGGSNNTISGATGTISGGDDNTISVTGINGTIGGGALNYLSGFMGTIGGGWDNGLPGNYGTVGGGAKNSAMGEFSFAGGGYFQRSSGDYSVIAGGDSNTAAGDYATIAGGSNNTITAAEAFTGGGFGNTISGIGAMIGGGGNNEATNTYAVIAGGYDNFVSGRDATISGGEQNYVSANYAAIGGGYRNTAVGFYSTIAGGIINRTANNYAAIGGGYGNDATGLAAAIPGGDSLQATSYAQTAIGFYNAPRGFVAAQPTTGAKATINDPLFMVGNGSALLPGPVVRSNAFEVSYNGHSVVYDVNGRTDITVPGRRVPFRGATYVDNIVYAWGDVTSGGTLNSDFGTVSVTHTPLSGVYNVRIDALDPQTGAPIVLTSGSVTVTLTELDESTPCAFINASRIGAYAPNQFRVRIRNSSCQPLDAHFMFKVTGRP